MLNLQHRQASGNHIAKALMPLRRELINGCAQKNLPTRQQCLQLAQLVAGPALKIGIVECNLLQAQHIETASIALLTHLQSVLHDTRHTDLPIHAAAPLRVPGQDLHLFAFLCIENG